MRQSISVTVLFACLFTLVPSAHAQTVNETHYIAGRVTDASGHPVQNVDISVRGTDGGGGGYDSPDAAGAFRMNNLRPGTYVVTMSSHWIPRQPQNVTTTVETPTDSLEFTVPVGVHLYGTVTDKDTGEAMTRLRFSQRTRSRNGLNGSYGLSLQTDDGRFALYSPPADEISMTLSAQGYVEHIIADSIAAVTGTVIGPLDVRLQKGAVIAGRVENATPYGDALYVSVRERVDGRDRVIQHMTPEDGRFHFNEVPPDGRYTVQAASHKVAEVTLANVEPGTRNVLLTMPQPEVFSGLVRDTTGNPVTSFLVTYIIANRDEPVAMYSNSRRFETEDGRFQLALPRADMCVIAIDTSDHVSALSDPFPVQAGIDPEPVSFTLQEGYTLTGQIVDARTRAPLDHITVISATKTRSLNHRQSSRATTDESGYFTLRAVPGGDSTLNVEDSHREREGRYATMERVISVTESRDLGQIALKSPGRVDVRLRWEDGTPITGGSVDCHQDQRARFARFSRPISATGYVSLRRLPEGELELRPWFYLNEDARTHHALELKTVDVEAGKTKEIEYVLPRGRVLTGTVTKNGSKVSEGSVIFFQLSSSGSRMNVGARTIIENGSYRLPVLVEGTYGVQVRVGGEEHPAVKKVAVEETGGEERLDIDVDSIKVTGRFLQGNGQPFKLIHGFIYPEDASDDEQEMWKKVTSLGGADSPNFKVFLPETGTYIVGVDGGYLNFEPVALEVPEEGLQDVAVSLNEKRNK